jgi:hypothetical protein
VGQLGGPRLPQLYQPRSMLWFGGIFCTLFGVFLVVIFWLASTGRMP